VTAPLESTTLAVVPLEGRRKLRAAHGRPVDPRPAAGRTERTLDGVLDLLERRPLTATELRILLAAMRGEVTVSELGESLGRRPADIRRIGARLYARGLLSWRHREGREETLFQITRAGMTMVRPLVTAAGGSAGP
jgi:DNA-binding MarR family transcriptional regulator